METLVGVAAAVLSVIICFPQIIKTFKRKSVEDLSSIMWWTLFLAQVLWFWYGVLISDWIIVATNIVTGACGGAMLVMIYRYR